jgi:uncharacterized protein with von Willebrand factor type A (vWA) domain
MPERFVANLLIFVRTLRAAGLRVRQGGVSDGVRALDLVGVRRRSDVRDALRAVLLSRPEDLAPFDELFDRFWRPRSRGGDARGPVPMQIPARARATVRLLAPAIGGTGAESSGEATDAPVGRSTYSDEDTWRRKDFAALSPEEAARAQDAVGHLAWSPGLRRTRRWRAGAGPGADLRRVLRATIRHGGEPIVIPRRERRHVPRPLVLLCDVSGSMEPYTRMLLLFAHALSGRARRVEVFVFSTRLTRVTREFAAPTAQAALPRVRDAVRDWSGGTRIGAAVYAFNAHWARRVLRGGPVVLLISDGWDLGEPSLLARETARLQRSVHRLVWLNPLIGSEGYEPLTRGMQAARPHVDDFLSVRNFSSLEALAEHLGRLGGR